MDRVTTELKIWFEKTLDACENEGGTNFSGELIMYLLQNPIDETHLDAVSGLISLRSFHIVRQKEEQKRRNYARAEQTDLLYSNAKDLIQSRRI